VLLRGGMLPQAYVYPQGMRETRDLLRRRTYLVRRRAEALAHLTNTNSQYNLPLVLGHALYMKAIHGGKAKTDKIDAKKIAVLLRGGMLPQAYVYPQGYIRDGSLFRENAAAKVGL
jgi:hypothetical protein